MTPHSATALCLIGAAFAANLQAGTMEAPVPAPAATGLLVGKTSGESELERIWSIPTLYKNPANPLLQELAFQGQLQTQYAYGSDQSGQFGSNDMPEDLLWGDIEVRRFRFGLRALMFNHLKFHSLLDIEPDLDPRLYKRTAETFLTYTFQDAFSISAGKAELKFTREQEISSREILSFERSQLANMMYGGELTGAWITGKNIAGGWLYELGVYGNDRRDEFSHFDGGEMILAKVGCDYTGSTTLDHALAEFHYLHNTEPGFTSPGDPSSPPYSDCIAISNEITEGRFGLTTELFWGDGALGRPDIYGFTAMPTWFLTEKLQLVTTFQLAASDEENGILLPTRYEALSPGAGDRSGDAYFAGYAGLDYYIHGHKLKLMSGVKYTYLDGGPGGGDFDGWTFMGGLRMAF